MSRSPSLSPTPSASNLQQETGVIDGSQPLQPNYTHVSAETLNLRTTNRRERNRIASQKCRARKSARLTYLEGRVAELEDEVRLLRAALGASGNSIPTTLGHAPPTPTLTPNSSLSSISSTRSLASVQSSSLSSITSTSSTDTIPEMDVDETEKPHADVDVARLTRENEELRNCMRTFEREWNAAISALAVRSVSGAVNGKSASSNAATENGSAEASSTPMPSQPLSSLATLLAAASQLPPV